jgi:hypothetical protein
MKVEWIAVVAWLCPSQALAQSPAIVQIDVRFNGASAGGPTVVASGVTFTTASSGLVSANVAAGTVKTTAVKDALVATTTAVTVQAGQFATRRR